MPLKSTKLVVETYNLNFTTFEGKVRGDVNQIDPMDIPEFDVVCAGFPCQPLVRPVNKKDFKIKKEVTFFIKLWTFWMPIQKFNLLS